VKGIDLTVEVTAVIERHVDEITPMDAIVHEVIANHQAISGTDRDFYMYCGYQHVRSVTREVLRGMRAGIAGTAQTDLFPGAKRVQRAYSVEQSEGEWKIIPLEKMQPADMRSKAREMRSMAQGLLEHAQELDDLADKIEASTVQDRPN
jgi:hypothetical protein